MDFYLRSVEETYKELNSGINGLLKNEASLRLEKYGYNDFVESKSIPLIIRFLKQLADPMIIILLFAALVSAALSIFQNDSFADVIIIMFVVTVNALLGVYQESKAEKSLEALKKMSGSKSKVRRDGQIIEIDSKELVPGDLVILETGDIIPADGRIVETASLKIEESSLTGESVPILKSVDILNLDDTKQKVPIADRKNMAYKGTIVVYGHGCMIVTDTGMNTEIGKIAGALSDVKESKTPLQIKMAQLSKILTWLVVGVCLIIFAVQLIKAQSLDFQFVLDSFMIAVTLAVAAIPEGLPAIVTVSLSIGVSKMAKRNAIVRKLTAVETLGCAQIICSDKTGTLTMNKMTVTDNFSFDKNSLSYCLPLCCDFEIIDSDVSAEPTEKALVDWAISQNIDTEKLISDYPRINEIPFESNRKMMTVVCSSKNTKSDNSCKLFDKLDFNKSCLQLTKGAPDVVISRCTKILRDGEIADITDDDINDILEQNKNMADKALRVLACSAKICNKDEIINNDTLAEEDLIFIGLVGMIDVARPEVKDSIEMCKRAGIRPIMITGDHIDTAKAIAIELDILDDSKTSVTGIELDNMSDSEFDKQFQNISVYARVQPEHKTRIVNAWQKAGYVVAMTGDGVNDAPSIKNADIGVGMGITGTDVSKNASDIVLADDNFATIVNAVEEGRRIYDNIIKCIQFLLSSNIGEVLGVFFASIFGFLLLRPVHLLWVNLITDCVPALALGVEHKEPDIMKRTPRPKSSGIFADGVLIDIIYQGLVITIIILIAYFAGFYLEFGYLDFQTSERGISMTFLTMSMIGCFHALNLRSRRQSIFKLKNHNFILYTSVVISLLLTSIVCQVPFIAELFKLSPLGITEWIISIFLSLSIIPIVEAVKLFLRKLKK